VKIRKKGQFSNGAFFIRAALRASDGDAQSKKGNEILASVLFAFKV
jgi:hypothetical protein